MFSDEIEKVRLINNKIEIINSYALDFFGEEENIICSNPLKCMDFTCAEGGFFHVVSWLYIKYFDNKKSQENLRFLIERTNLYPAPNGFDLNKHKQLIKRIRTFLHHDIGERNNNNIRIENATHAWFQKYCSNFIPQTEKEWRTSLNGILEDALTFFTIISERTVRISNDEFKSVILTEWEKSIIPFSVFDISQIVKELAGKKGLQNLDCFTYSKNNYDKWIRDLKNFNEPSEDRLKQIILASLNSIH